jgi:hypothetical protein
MFTVMTAFANVQWLWVLKAGIVLSCLYLFIHRGMKMKRPSLVVDLCITIVLATIWVVYLVRSHASAGAMELVFAFCFAYVVESVITFFWRWRTADKSDPDGQQMPTRSTSAASIIDDRQARE